MQAFAHLVQKRVTLIFLSVFHAAISDLFCQVVTTLLLGTPNDRKRNVRRWELYSLPGHRSMTV